MSSISFLQPSAIKVQSLILLSPCFNLQRVMLILLAASSQMNFRLASAEAVFISNKVNYPLQSRVQFPSFCSAGFQASLPAALHDPCGRHFLRYSCARDTPLRFAAPRVGILLFLLLLLFNLWSEVNRSYFSPLLKRILLRAACQSLDSLPCFSPDFAESLTAERESMPMTVMSVNG